MTDLTQRFEPPPPGNEGRWWQGIPARELSLAFAALGVAAALRVVYIFHLAVDSDEPQHLHVVWAWVNGLLPYRDVYDDHTPLFHLLGAPLFAALGERTDIVVWMRFAMLPAYVVALSCTFAIGRALFDARVGLFASASMALLSPFMSQSTEFRPDVFWAATWLVAVTILVRGPVTRNRAAMAGLVLGVSFGFSIKAALLLACLAVPALWVVTAPAGAPLGTSWRRATGRAAALVLGFAIVPALLVLFFALRGASGPLWHCLVECHRLPRQDSRALLLPFFLPPLWWAAREIARRARDPERGLARGAMFLLAATSCVAFPTLSPLPQREDWLALYGPLIVFLTAALFALLPAAAARDAWTPRRLRSWTIVFPALVLLAELQSLLVANPPGKDDTRDCDRLVGDVLRLTDAGDFVMDVKGNAIYRERPFFYALVGAIRLRMDLGLIADAIPERLVATRTCVVGRIVYPARAVAFIRRNYVCVGSLWVAGQLLLGPETVLDLAIPARYALVAERGTARGFVDGTAYGGARWLDAGKHEIRLSPDAGRVALVWEQAASRGFSPFAGGGGP